MYIDPQGKMEGPFDSPSMKAWYDAGYFTAEIQIGHTGWSAYHRLGGVFPDPATAFLRGEVAEPQALAVATPEPESQPQVITAAEARAANEAAIGAAAASNKPKPKKPQFPSYGGYKKNRR